jgi:hypothetical protein
VPGKAVPGADGARPDDWAWARWARRLEAHRPTHRLVEEARHLATSSDAFFSRAFEWFGVPGASHLEARRKGERLAELFSAQRSLLILDGLEPFQQGAPDEGRLRDIALQALLQELAGAPRGLCLVTTRIALADPASRQIDLHNLSVPDAVRLLDELGVRGLTQELEAAARAFDCHPLALLLLGTYLKQLRISLQR